MAFEKRVIPQPRDTNGVSSATPPDGHSRRRLLTLGCLLVAIGGVGLWFLWDQVEAWSSYRRGKAAIEDDPAAARGYFDRCLATWSSSGEMHFLAAQAARRCGDVSEASRHLDEAARHGWSEAAIGVERALMEAQARRLGWVEPVLLRALGENDKESHHILAVLVPAYMAEFRWLEADAATKKWVEIRPEAATAWRCRGEIFERLRKREEAVNAFRKAVELAPDDRRTRLNLSRLLLEIRQPASEAARHLEWLAGADPDNPAVLVQLAACREAQNRTAEAVALLDRVIADHPPDSKAYHFRGRLELNRGRPAAAVPFLRNAADLDPYDPEVLYSLLLSLQQTEATAEARTVEERWKRCDGDLKRAAELGRAIAAAPHDPDLRREMGELFLRNGRDSDGLRWLDSALREWPEHAETHRVLAAYYERIGQPDKAAYHRAFIPQPLPGGFK